MEIECINNTLERFIVGEAAWCVWFRAAAYTMSDIYRSRILDSVAQLCCSFDSSKFNSCGISPFAPLSDQQTNSLYSINTLSTRQMMRRFSKISIRGYFFI